MSIPRNHHFVSQVHIKNFFNSEKGKIFLYDKLANNHYFKTTTKSVFSEKDLNSKFDKGELDHISIEKDLNEHFEKDFSQHLGIVENFLTEFNLTNEVNESLIYFAKYGIIGEIRNPRHKKELEETIHNAFSEIYKMFDSNLKKEFDEAFAYKKETEYINAVKYSKFANDIIKLMGNLIFIIETPKNDKDFFLLPDFCSANRREKINTYFNPDVKEIAYIGLPLTSKIYIHFYSSKIENIKPNSGIYEMDSLTVDKLNKMNYDYCQSKVACENEEYLKYFIKNVAQQRI
ncbi:DUF4238 domain-containing protein [Lacinutrix cladophorae]